jgi:hypothetical protein
MNAARPALEQPGTWHGLTSAPPACGIGEALWAGDSEIAHFHSPHDADLHLTRIAIQRGPAAPGICMGDPAPGLRRRYPAPGQPGRRGLQAHERLRDRRLDGARGRQRAAGGRGVAGARRPHPSAAPCNMHHVTITPNAGPAPAPDRTGTPGGALRSAPDTTMAVLQGAEPSESPPPTSVSVTQPR